MEKLVLSSEFFNVKDTLECGQVFRFFPYEKGFLVVSINKCAYVYQEDNFTVIECEKEDKDYFYNYFDLDRDYGKIYSDCLSENVPILTTSANAGKGIRLLNQDKKEVAFSFIVSQNNNIPRIKSIIEKLSILLGEKREFMGKTYYSFPTAKAIMNATNLELKETGLGYRVDYVKSLAKSIEDGLNLEELSKLDTKALKKRLLSIHGIGPKVADCITLFGYKKSDSFPVDTWIEKVYREDLGGTTKDRVKIADELTFRFGSNSGYYQQYLFYYKRSIENK